jgi:hypothetical protein
MTRRAKIIIAAVAAAVVITIIIVLVLALGPTAAITAQIGPLAGQSRPMITVNGSNFPATREIYVGLAAPNVPPTAGTSFVTVMTDRAGKFSVTFPYPAESNWTTLSEVTVYAGTPEGDAVGIARLKLSGIAWLLTAQPSPTSLPSATLTKVITASPTPTRPGPTATPTASATPSTTPAPVPVISLQPTGGHVGTAVVVTGRGWNANETLYLGLLGSTTQTLWDLGIARVDAQGNLTVGFVFPADWVGATVATVLVRSADSSRQAVAIFQVTGQVTPVSPTPASPTPLVITGWLGQYFNNILLAGDPALVRNDDNVDFNWGSGSPASGTVAGDRFSARWTRTLYFTAGDYRFWAEADDGVRLWLDDRPVIDEWHTASGVRYTGDVNQMGEGQHAIRVEYYEDTGAAQVRVGWQQVVITPTHTPTNTPTHTPTLTPTATHTPTATSTPQ